MVELMEGSRMAIDELIDVLGRASIEAVLGLSARGVAGEKQQGPEEGIDPLVRNANGQREVVGSQVEGAQAAFAGEGTGKRTGI